MTPRLSFRLQREIERNGSSAWLSAHGNSGPGSSPFSPNSNDHDKARHPLHPLTGLHVYGLPLLRCRNTLIPPQFPSAWIFFQDIAPSIDLLRPLLPHCNPYLRSLKVDCTRLDDSSLDSLLHPSLQELCLRNCADFSGRLLSELGRTCKDLRFLYLSSVAEKRGRSVDVLHLEEMLSGCTQLEVRTLILMFDVSVFLRHSFARVWALASPKLISLEIEYISSVMMTELLNPAVGLHQTSSHPWPSVLPNLQKLCLSVDYITDTMVSTISKCLVSLTHLDLRDIPIMEPRMAFDLTNNGLQQINAHGKLKHLCLVRSQEIAPTFFKRVNDLGILLMADKCSAMESICLGGFCQVTDTDLSTLDLRDCRNLGDEALRAISMLPKLKTLLLDGCDLTDAGLSYLSKGVMNHLVSLSVRGCKRLTDRCISSLFDGKSNPELRELDLSNLPNISDAAVLLLARSRILISELRMRQCPLIGDTSVMALASMQVDENTWCGSSLRLLDIYNCGGITQLAFRWLKKPYFPRLRWLGVTGSMNRDAVEALARSRPYIHVTTQGEELGTEQWDNMEDAHLQDYDDVDEFEEWLLGGGGGEGEGDDDDYEDEEQDMSDAEMEDAVGHES
ncbi:F-box/LRR-repeat protein 10 isoform X6 [Salvia hispanica]|uniref:F-box/LRR-repeat protein 10 isoform X6 n=1 Tax=Salvia hispanica TaxID=49212 RepID=UPI0020097BEB|nr:F-box/LRR-repeat protein 10 isoform X6 [Salvia hispanica]